METTFVVTGVHRTSLKNYRPSLKRPNSLDPIYEDSPVTTTQQIPSFQSSVQNNQDYAFIPKSVQNGGLRCHKNFSNHIMEETDYTREAKLEVRRLSLPPKSSSSMIDGIMRNLNHIKRRSSENWKQVDNRGILNSISRDNTSTSPKSHDDVRVNGTVSRGDLGLQNANRTENTNELSNPIVPVRISSLYRCNPGEDRTRTDTITMTYLTDTSTRWPKLEPEPPKDSDWCPAEDKFKKRCFAICFVVLILLIATFVLVTIEGWLFSSTGKGFGGKPRAVIQETLLKSPPTIFGVSLNETNSSDVL